MKSKKIKQMISTIVIATTVASTIPTVINPTAAFASSDITYSAQTEAETAGFSVRLINNDAEYEIAEYTGTNANVTIPSQINGKSVTSIGVGAFESRTGLTSVTIPSSVRSINQGAFYHCSGLRSVTMQSGVTSIGNGAFAYCSGLTSIEIPSSVTSVDNNAFRYSGLTSIEIPNSVTSIGDMAFAQCPGLSSIEIPSSVTSIGSAAFTYVNDTATFYVPNVRIAELVKPYLAGTHMQIIINSDLELETKTATTATISFGAQTGATSLKVQKSIDGGNTWTNAETEALTASSTSTTITGLTAGKNYKFRLLMNDDFYGSSLDVTTDSSIVTPAVNSVSVTPLIARVSQGHTKQLTPTVSAAGGVDRTITWSSSDSKVTVDSNGLVTVASGATPGDYIIAATSTVDSSKKGTATITVIADEPAENETTPAAVTVESVESLDDIIVNNGTARNDLDLPDTVDVTLSNSTTTSAQVRWEDVNYSAYNGHKVGTYVFTGTLILPEGVSNPYDYASKVNVIVKASSRSSSSHHHSSSTNTSTSTTVDTTIANNTDTSTTNTSTNTDTANSISGNSVEAWKKDKSGNWYLEKNNGNKIKGWKLVDNKWYFFNNNTGAMTTGWYKSESGDWTYDGKDTVDQWFHLESDGKMNTGWFKDTDGNWYYLCDGSDYGALGVMKTGWKQIDDNWYYFNSNGTMASDTVIDGYTLGNDGAWIR